MENKKKFYWLDERLPSKGETLIEKWLKDHEIFHIMEARLSDLINSNTHQNLIVDFFLPNHKVVIEFNGEQHYNYIKKLHGPKRLGKFEKQKEKDELKRSYCKSKGYKLIEIKYDQMDQIGKILKRELSGTN